ncbi:MAG: hypothetical protein WKG00_38205 [Polyangiaceae bacterium]
MTKTAQKWSARVQAWRASGQTAPEFCLGKEFKAGGLRYWASRLQREATEARDVRIAHLVRPGTLATAETPMVLEVGRARVGIRRGFDAETLRALLTVLAEVAGA